MKGRSVPWAGAIVLLLVLFLSSGCRSAPAAKKVRLHRTEPLSTGAPKYANRMPLRVAVAAIISPRSTFTTYQSLLDYLGNQVGRSAQLIQRPTYAEINDLLRTGGVDMAFVCTRAYVEGHDDFGMELLAVPQIHGQAVYYSYIIVSAKANIYSLEDLRGHSFAFTDPLSNTGHLVPIYLLKNMGESPGTFFERTIFTYSHDNSIRSVAEGVVDAAAVDSLVYDQMVQQDPSLAEKTRIIYRSPPYGAPPVVVHPNMNPELKKSLQQQLLHLHETAEGKKILSQLGIDRFVLPDDSAYDTVRAMIENVSNAGSRPKAQR
jgi:phosphonate transport system substrate-binding protein